MLINIDNFSDTVGFNIDLRQKEVDGGKITKEKIDVISRYPNAQSMIVSGLEQSTFEYLINRYGQQFKAISFHKNKAVEDLSLLSGLTHIEYISFFWNQKAKKLWDMSSNSALRGLQLDDFLNLHSINEIQTAPRLEVFNIGDALWQKMRIESLKPVALSTVTSFSWYGHKVMDEDYACLSNGKIKTLNISPKYFTMDELAGLISLFPNDLQGEITKPYQKRMIKDVNGKETVYYYLCKGKKPFIEGNDDEKFKRYLNEFDVMVKKYREYNTQMCQQEQ